MLGLADESAKKAAEVIASDWLNGAQLLQGGTASLSHESMIKYCTRSIRGRVCWGAAVGLRLKNIRGLPESDKKSISIVLVGCTEADSEGMNLPQKEHRKFLGISSA